MKNYYTNKSNAGKTVYKKHLQIIETKFSTQDVKKRVAQLQAVNSN